MSLSSARIGKLQIPAGAAVSNTIFLGEDTLGDATVIVVAAPQTLDVLTFTFQTNDDPTGSFGSGSGWVTLNDATGAAVKVPAQGTSIFYPNQLQGALGLRMASSGNVVRADCIFVFTKQFVAHQIY